ncbi:IPT/TIG domain-containing protein [Actinocrinis puniceicyclus]|uniref:IPT/TIG domain-containing protein n=1 Tax=Actinocrinis puniceicyclus TaxID=977794 RepID=A0A8J7WRU1_9ACTN|nr:IPT/TIG domain-containing protein [Actinocrinis puniceicyclus]MBS2964979.1 IPT/TIG domain-containing protein [Actinocrinis puniceicyclus]
MSVPLGTWDFVFTPGAPYAAVTKHSVVVSGDQTLDVVLVQNGVGTMSGRVVDDLGAPLAGVQVGLFDQNLGSYGAATGSDGRFTVYAKNGSYGLQLSAGDSVVGDVPRPPSGAWYLQTGNQSLTVNGDTSVGDIALPALVHLAVTVLDPANNPVAAGVNPSPYSAAVVPGFATLLGIPIASGAVIGTAPQYTGTDGTIPGFTYWPTTALTLNVTPGASPQLLPTTTPPINLTTSADLVVAYQTNGSVSLIAGSAHFYTTLQSTTLNVPAPGVLANDSNPTGLAVQAQLAQSPAHGSLTLNADGSFAYTPANGFVGNDNFTYRITAPGIQTPPIPVTITVSPPPLPVVTAISPSNGPATGGTSVTITGSHFTSATDVTFGTIAASAFTVINDTTITATAPAAAPSLVDIHVSTQFGTSQTTSPDQYTYNPPPTVSAISPAHGPEAGGTSVTITGTGLSGATSVMFGSKPATSFAVNSDTSITATAPAQADGTIDITVTTPAAGTSTPASTDHYTYDEPAPTITRISPSQGPKSGGTAVTITGSDFTGTTAVKFGTVAATSFTVISDTSITATAPPAAAVGPIDITVTTSPGTSATGAADRYTYAYPFNGFLAPVISSDYNQVHAGQGIPIQFQIGGDQGLSIIASGFPTVQQISCSTGAPINTATLTDTAGGGGLSYSASTSTYSYVWKTSKTWAGTCQQFDLRLNDGIDHVALFSFK